MPVLLGGHNLHNLPPLVEIGLTDLPKSGTPGTPVDDMPANMLVYLLSTIREAFIPNGPMTDWHIKNECN